MSFPPDEYLRHILRETAYILRASNGVSKEEFLKSETLKRAYVRSLEIIGEAVKQLPDELRHNYSSIEWRAIAGMQDRLIHVYFGVDYDVVWDVVVNKIPELDAEVKRILKETFSED
ncbi:MAG: HepT-like ribonuclease domain-containing protein [Cyanobacteria bacterium J06621_11]